MSSKDVSPAMYDNSHVLNVLISSTESTEDKEDFEEDIIDDKTANGWTKENEATIRKWQLDIEKSSFVYSEQLNNITNKMNIVLTSSLIFSTCNALFSALTITLAFLNEKWVSVCFSILILLTSTCNTIMNGLLTNYGWDKEIQILSPYVEKLNNTWFNFEIELNIPANQRTNAVDFIKRYDGQYMSLMHQCPSISTQDYMNASHKYQKDLFDNYMWSQKFRKDMITQLKEIKIDS